MLKNCHAIRIVKTFKMDLCGDAKSVFHLLCPVKEIEWIEGWKDICRLIYSESGIAEEACVFETENPIEGRAVWICSRYDLENTKIEYIKHIIDKAIIKWTMEVNGHSKDTSSISLTYNATSLTEEGNHFVRELMEIRFPMFMQKLQEDINFYLSTGEMKRRIENI